MLSAGTLNAHLEETNQAAEAMPEQLMTQIAKREGVTEEVKANDPFPLGAGHEQHPPPYF